MLKPWKVVRTLVAIGGRILLPELQEVLVFQLAWLLVVLQQFIEGQILLLEPQQVAMSQVALNPK